MECHNTKCIKHDDTCPDNCERFGTHDIARCKLVMLTPQAAPEAGNEEYSILLDQLKEKIQRLEIAEERYEKIRKFDPRQFSALYSADGQSMVGFDDMLDRWEV